MNQSQLKFGIILDSNSIELWQNNLIKTALKEKNLELSFIHVLNQQESKKPLLWFFKKGNSRKTIQLSTAFKNVNIISLKELDGFNEIDFVFDFSSNNCFIQNKELTNIPCFSFNQNIDLLGFWELFKSKNTVEFNLYKVDANGLHIIKKGVFKSYLNLSKTQDQILTEVSYWLHQICCNNTKTILVQENDETIIYPNNTQLIKLYFSVLINKIKKAVRSNLYVDFWNIGIVRAPIQSFLESEKPKVEWYPNITKTSFAADPFGFWEQSKLHIFFEAYPFNKPSGRIDYVSFENGKYSKEEIVFDNPYHNSYPYLLKHENKVYCIPESCENGSVEIFELDELPNKWIKKKTLLPDFAGADSTIIFKEGTWWMFTVDLNDNPHYNLYLYYCDNLLGEWKPHPLNPVKTDVSSSRPAGNIFEYNGVLYRPSMDYSEKIQGRIIINKIVTLTKEDFNEVSEKVVNPYKGSKFGDKIHTLAMAGDYTIVDGCKETSIFSNITLFKFGVKQFFKS